MRADELVVALHELGPLRVSVSRLSLSPKQAIDQYSTIVTRALDLSSSISRDT